MIPRASNSEEKVCVFVYGGGWLALSPFTVRALDSLPIQAEAVCPDPFSGRQGDLLPPGRQLEEFPWDLNFSCPLLNK